MDNIHELSNPESSELFITYPHDLGVFKKNINPCDSVPRGKLRQAMRYMEVYQKWINTVKQMYTHTNALLKTRGKFGRKIFNY
jgi:hypothetical protein